MASAKHLGLVPTAVKAQRPSREWPSWKECNARGRCHVEQLLRGSEGPLGNAKSLV